MISPKVFRKYLKSGYSQMFSPCRQANKHIRFHSDDHILEIIDDLVEIGVDIIRN